MDSDDIGDDLYSSDTPMDYEFMANEESVDLDHDVVVDDDDDDEDHGFPDPIIRFKHENYVVLKEEDVVKRLEDHVSKVSSVLSVSAGEATLMLIHYNWNVDAVHEAWFSDEERVRKAVGLVRVSSSSSSSSSPSSSSLVGCGICFDGYDFGKVESLACGHFFCFTCWGMYISTSIHDGIGCLTLKCPTPKCGVSVGKEMVQKFASEVDFHKYDHYFVRSYVEGNKKIKWCPAPGCEAAIEYVAGTGNYDVTCSCSYIFCWNCTNEVHRPVNCETVGIWNEKNNNESENANWILAFTKPCPKCKRPIEKNQGCMHMTCRAPCGHEFCWTCLQDYRSHGICNRYEGRTNEGVVIDEDEMKRRKAKNMLERYMHYYERWVANMSSREKARADLKKMQSVHLKTLSLKHCQTDEALKFIVQAWLQIIECRRVLKWTYAYGYYLPEEEGTKKRFFEYLQGEAEAGLERLHRCAEKELEHYLEDGEGAPREDFNEYRTKLIGLTRATRTYFENLVRALENGLADVDSEDSPGQSKKGSKRGSKGNGAAEKKRKTDGKSNKSSSTGGSSRNYVTIISSDDD